MKIKLNSCKSPKKIRLGHPTGGIGRGQVWPVKRWEGGIGLEFVPCREMFSERLVRVRDVRQGYSKLTFVQES